MIIQHPSAHQILVGNLQCPRSTSIWNQSHKSHRRTSKEKAKFIRLSEQTCGMRVHKRFLESDYNECEFDGLSELMSVTRY